MALIKCSDCGNEYSDRADICPKCGCPNDVKRKAKRNRYLEIQRKKNVADTIAVYKRDNVCNLIGECINLCVSNK